jgi:acyl-CoA reductase-like NAD-dependent aldehyde dehydrogenase
MQTPEDMEDPPPVNTSYQPISEVLTLRAIEEVTKAFHEWSQTPRPERGRIVYRFADLLEHRKDEASEILIQRRRKEAQRIPR